VLRDFEPLFWGGEKEMSEEMLKEIIRTMPEDMYCIPHL